MRMLTIAWRRFSVAMVSDSRFQSELLPFSRAVIFLTAIILKRRIDANEALQAGSVFLEAKNNQLVTKC
jgi:hypothetical protein